MFAYGAENDSERNVVSSHWLLVFPISTYGTIIFCIGPARAWYPSNLHTIDTGRSTAEGTSFTYGVVQLVSAISALGERRAMRARFGRWLRRHD